MAIRGIFKTFFPSGWIYGEYEDLKNQNKSLWQMLKSLFSKDVPTRTETFEQALARMNLTEADIAKTASSYRGYAFLFFLIGVALFAYAFYLLFAYLSFTGWLLGLAATTFAWGQAFRYDFWAYQIRMRKLGVTFKEWKQSILGDKGASQ